MYVYNIIPKIKIYFWQAYVLPWPWRKHGVLLEPAVLLSWKRTFHLVWASWARIPSAQFALSECNPRKLLTPIISSVKSCTEYATHSGTRTWRPLSSMVARGRRPFLGPNEIRGKRRHKHWHFGVSRRAVDVSTCCGVSWYNKCPVRSRVKKNISMKLPKNLGKCRPKSEIRRAVSRGFIWMAGDLLSSNSANSITQNLELAPTNHKL